MGNNLLKGNLLEDDRKLNQRLLKNSKKYFCKTSKLNEIMMQALLKPTTNLSVLISEHGNSEKNLKLPFKIQNVNQLVCHSRKLMKILLKTIFSQILKNENCEVIFFANTGFLKFEEIELFDPTQNRKNILNSQRRIHVFKSENLYEFLDNLRKAKHLSMMNKKIKYVVIDDVERFNIKISKFILSQTMVFRGAEKHEFDRKKYEKLIFCEILKFLSDDFQFKKDTKMNRMKIFMIRRSRIDPKIFSYQNFFKLKKNNENFPKEKILFKGSSNREFLANFLKDLEFRQSQVKIKIFYIFDFYELNWIKAYSDIELVREIYHLLVKDRQCCVSLVNYEMEDCSKFYIKVLRFDQNKWEFEVLGRFTQRWDFEKEQVSEMIEEDKF